MPKKYSKQYGWYKHYNKNGTSCRIKIKKEPQGQVIIKFRDQDSITWNYFVPSKLFGDSSEVIHYLVQNLEKSGTLFEVISPNTGEINAK